MLPHGNTLQTMRSSYIAIPEGGVANGGIAMNKPATKKTIKEYHYIYRLFQSVEWIMYNSEGQSIRSIIIHVFACFSARLKKERSKR